MTAIMKLLKVGKDQPADTGVKVQQQEGSNKSLNRTVTSVAL